MWKNWVGLVSYSHSFILSGSGICLQDCVCKTELRIELEMVLTVSASIRERQRPVLYNSNPFKQRAEEREKREV